MLGGLFLLSYYQGSDNKLKLHYMLGGFHMGMKTRGVTFNIEDPEQYKLYQYTLKMDNFSGYIKELIRKDRASKVTTKKPGGIKITL